MNHISDSFDLTDQIQENDSDDADTEDGLVMEYASESCESDDDSFSTLGDPITEEEKKWLCEDLSHPAGDIARPSKIRCQTGDETNDICEIDHTSNDEAFEDLMSLRSKSSSLADHWFQNQKVLFVSFDLETGGENAGILQISATMKDQSGNGVGHAFNSYVKPAANAHISEESSAIHGLKIDDERLVNAEPIKIVWPKFTSWANENHTDDRVGIFVAWGGASCDLNWIYKLLHDPAYAEYDLVFPDWIKFFMDPCRVIRHYSMCQINPSKSEIPNLKLKTVYQHVTGDPLEGAHDSLVDACGQMRIIFDKRFKGFWNRAKSVVLIDNIWDKKQKRSMDMDHESRQLPHSSWKVDEQAESWKMPYKYKYTSAGGGPKSGPTNEMRNLIEDEANELADLFLYFVTPQMLEDWSNASEYYGYEEPVVPEGGTPNNPRTFRRCGEEADGKRSRCKEKNFHFSPGYLLAWIGITILHGNVGTDRSPTMWYRKSPYGLSYPVIQNTMSRNAWIFVKRFLHFATTSQGPKPDDPKYDPLFKIRSVLDTVQEKLHKAWNCGEKVTIDEGMVKYNGRAIKFVQYMPKKPIKHGIKLFIMCDAQTAYVYAFFVYLGKEFASEKTGVEIVDRLIQMDKSLVVPQGRTLYVDNFYTSFALARHLMEKYKWMVVGTYALTAKAMATREKNDFPFSLLSSGAMKKVRRGFMRRATLRVDGSRGFQYVIQATIWKDKKLVGWFHTQHVGEVRNGKTTTRRGKNQPEPEVIECPPVQEDYAHNFNAVDISDKDSAIYSCSIRSNRWYLRLFFWCLDKVVFSIFIICREYVCHGGTRRPGWSKYLHDSANGRYDFGIDLGLSLIERGIRMDWKRIGDKKTKPRWMRQMPLIPCDCAACFFCKEGMTTGITHTFHARPAQPAQQHASDCGCSDTRSKKRKHPSLCCVCKNHKTREGCPCGSCPGVVCRYCWEAYHHNK